MCALFSAIRQRRDGELEAACFTASKKHEKDFPSHAIPFNFRSALVRSPNRDGKMRCFEKAAFWKDHFIKGAGAWSLWRIERALC